MKSYLIVCIGIILLVQCLKHQFADKMLNEKKACSGQQSVVLEFHNKKVMYRVREITKIM